MIPILYLRIIGAVAIMAVLAFSVRYVYSAGADSVQVKWDADKLAAENQAELLRHTRQSTISNKAIQYKAKSEKIRVVTKTIIKEVEKHVPNTLPMLPGAIRLYIDAAASGEDVDDSRIANASPISPLAVTRSVTENYGACNADKQLVIALQAVIRAAGIKVVPDDEYLKEASK